MSGHGGAIYGEDGRAGDLLDFSVNIHPAGVPPAVREFFRRGDLALLAGRYPDPASRALRRALLHYEAGFSGARPVEAQLLVGHGASGLIQALAETRRFRRVFLCAPLFSGYRRAFAAAGSTLVLPEGCRAAGEADGPGNRRPGRPAAAQPPGFPGDPLPGDIRGQLLRSGADLIILCNPGNPTGLAVSMRQLRELLSFCAERGIGLLVDECFLEFLEDGGDRSLAPLVPKGSATLIVLRALTKYFGLPGLRIGYAWCSDRDLAREIEGHLPEWDLSGIAQEAARIALSEDTVRERRASLLGLCSERERLRVGLESLGLAVAPGRADYLLFYSPVELAAPLRERGILIRACDDYDGLPPRGYYRTAVRSREEDDRLLEVIRDVQVTQKIR